MKKIIIIFPLIVLSLASCNKQQTKKKNSSSTITSSSEILSTSSATQTTTMPTAIPRPGEYRFKQKEGDWEVYLDFTNYYLDYKRDFPFIQADSGIQIFDLADLTVMGNGCYVSSYNAKGFILMKNTGGYASTSGVSFLTNDVPLYHIKEVTVTSASNTDRNVNYNVYIGNEKVYRTGGCLSGTDVGLEGTVTGDGSYFCITQTNERVDGKIASICVKYHYEIPEPIIEDEEGNLLQDDVNNIE